MFSLAFSFASFGQLFAFYSHCFKPLAIIIKLPHCFDRYSATITDLLLNNLSAAISIFRLRLCKNFSTYTPYMLQNFCFASLEI